MNKKGVSFLTKYQELDKKFFIESIKDVWLQKKNSNFNYYRYDIKDANARYSFIIEGLEADYEQITVGIFDFKINKIVQYFVFPTDENISFNFITGDDVEGFALCIYAGVFRTTKNKSLKIKNISVLEKRLSLDEKISLIDNCTYVERIDIDREIDDIIFKYNLDKYYPRYKLVRKAEKLMKLLASEWGENDKIAFISIGDKMYNGGRHFRNRSFLYRLFNDEQWKQITFIYCDRKGAEAEKIKTYNPDLYDYQQLERTNWYEYNRVYIISNSGDNFVGQWLRRHKVMYTSIYDYFSLNGLEDFSVNKIDFYDFIFDKSESCFDLHSYRTNPIVYEFHEQKCKYDFNRKNEYKQLFLKKMIFLLLVLRDIEAADRYVELLDCSDNESFKYHEAMDKVWNLVGEIKRRFKNRNQSDILALWIDCVSKEQMMQHMPFLYSLKDKSIWFEDMITMNGFTHEVLKTMFLRKKLIDDNTDQIKTIKTDNSIVVTDLEQNGYKVINIGDRYFPRKYLTEQETALYWPSSMRLWETVRQILQSDKPCFVLTHTSLGTHPPYLSTLMDDEKLSSHAERAKAGRHEMDNLLRFYIGMLGPKTISLIFSDHGGEFFWPRLNTFMAIYSPKYRPVIIHDLCSNFDFYKILHGIINGIKISIDSISKGWAEIQGNNIRNGNIKSVMNSLKFPLNGGPSFAKSFCGYRGIVTKEYVYLYFSNKRELLLSRKSKNPSPKWYKREEDCCNADLLPYFRELANTKNGMPTDMIETDYFKDLRKVFNSAYPRNIKKIKAIKSLFTDLKKAVIYGGSDSSKEFYYALDTEQRNKIVGFIDKKMDCTCASIGLPIFIDFEDYLNDTNTILVTERNILSMVKSKYEHTRRIIGIYEYFEENGIECKSKFWDFELCKSDFLDIAGK